MGHTATVISLVVFDGDDTLWYGLDGGYICGVDIFDAGRDDFTFTQLNTFTIQRDDGYRFRLFPEVPGLLKELEQRDVLISLASYNHPSPVMAALRAFAIERFFHHPVVEWSSDKARMLKSILRQFIQDGYLVSPATTLFIDDDHRGVYRSQMASSGIHFLQRGVDILDLSELLEQPRFKLVPIQKSLV